MVDTWKEAEERIRKAMVPPKPKNNGDNFSPGIQGLRRSAKQLQRPRPGNQPLPTVR